MAQIRKRVHLSAASCAVVLLSLVSLKGVNAATTCAAKVQAALKTLQGDGVRVSCCKPDVPECQLSAIGACDDVYTTWGWCLGVGSSSACAISYGPDADEPCGAYAGPVGKTFGLSPVNSGYKVALQSAGIQSAVQANWAQLSTLSDVGLCCSADAASCHLGKVLTLAANPCNTGEYELKCFGTATHGLCAAYNNVAATSELGQYYFVNFEKNATTPAAPISTAPASSTGASQPSSSASDSTTAPGSTPASGTAPTSSGGSASAATGSVSSSRSQPSGSATQSPSPSQSQASSTVGGQPLGSSPSSNSLGSPSATGSTPGSSPSASDLSSPALAESKKSSLNIAAVVVPIILALILIGLGVWFFVWRRRRAALAFSTGGTGNSLNPYPTSTVGSSTSAWVTSPPMAQAGSSSAPFASALPPATGKYERFQHEQRPMSPQLPPYSLSDS